MSDQGASVGSSAILAVTPHRGASPLKPINRNFLDFCTDKLALSGLSIAPPQRRPRSRSNWAMKVGLCRHCMGQGRQNRAHEGRSRALLLRRADFCRIFIVGRTSKRDVGEFFWTTTRPASEYSSLPLLIVILFSGETTEVRTFLVFNTCLRVWNATALRKHSRPRRSGR